MSWSDFIRWGEIPDRMHGGITRYVENGIPPGHFLQALFKNDLMEACSRGDRENLHLIPDYAKLLWNQLPSASWGSQENYREWIARGGLEGNDKHQPLPSSEWSRWAESAPTERKPR